jgi:predicted acetyltransferase
VKLELLEAGSEHRTVLENLMELYLYDWSEMNEILLDDQGHYGYDYLPQYFVEPERRAFLARADGHWAGFALLRDLVGRTDVAEFFVARYYRRKALGTQFARELWDRVGGSWQVRVWEGNVAAVPFWERVVSGYASRFERTVESDDEAKNWNVYRFESRR